MDNPFILTVRNGTETKFIIKFNEDVGMEKKSSIEFLETNIKVYFNNDLVQQTCNQLFNFQFEITNYQLKVNKLTSNTIENLATIPIPNRFPVTEILSRNGKQNIGSSIRVDNLGKRLKKIYRAVIISKIFFYQFIIF